MTDSIVARNEHFSQVCVWPGTLCGKDKVEEFTAFMLDELKVRIQYLEEVETLPDRDQRGNTVPGTGGRNDLIFAVHSDDVAAFAVPRFQYGIRWIEDVLTEHNHGRSLYAQPERLDQYKTW